MKKIITTIAALALLAPAAYSEVTDELTYKWGPADTIEHHSIGPGMEYAKIIFPNKPLILWWVEVDLQNEYAKVEQVQSRHAVPDVERWDVMTHYRENSAPGHQVKVAWNHDFFSYDMGVAIGINISEGEMTWNPWGRSVLAITDEGKAEVFCAGFDSHLTTADGTTVAIDYYNAFEGGLYGDCILYNRFNSKTLGEEGRYIALQPLDRWLVNGDPVRCDVLEISDTPLQTGDGRYVLYLRGSKLNALDGHISAGETVTVTQNFLQPQWGTSPAHILNAFHGYPSIVHNGQLQDGEYNNFENGREHELSSRVMAGISADKTKLYIATTELSAQSVGVDCIELSAWMVEKGAYDVVNFDSGGSAAIVIDGDMLNLPGRGSVRPVVDAMLAVSLAPEDNQADHLCFSRPRIAPPTISRTPLRVLSQNRYNEVIEKDVAGCEFSCEPADLGYVDSEGIFHASGKAMTGKIIARKGSLTGEMEVCTQPIRDIRPIYTDIMIDNRRHIMVDVSGICNGLETEVDPGAFEWKFSADGIAAIDEDGLLYGVSNGTTILTGEYEEISFDINVTVENADDTMTVDPFTDLDRLGFTKSSSVKNADISYTRLPEGWTSGADIRFDLSASRSSSMTFTPKATLYGLPESVSMRVYDKTGATQRINLQFTDRHGTRLTLSANTEPGDRTYDFPFKEESGETFAYHRYPLTLNRISINLTNSAIDGSEVAFGALTANYPAAPGSGIESASVYDGGITFATEGEELTATAESTSAGTARLCLYGLGGHAVHTDDIEVEAGHNTLHSNIKFVGSGIYIGTLSMPDGRIMHGKIIVR